MSLEREKQTVDTHIYCILKTHTLNLQSHGKKKKKSDGTRTQYIITVDTNFEARSLQLAKATPRQTATFYYQ